MTASKPRPSRNLVWQIICLMVMLIWMVTAVAVEEITIAGLFRDRAIVILDGVQRVLVPGKPSPEGVVLISATSKEAILEVNGARQSYKLGDHITSQFTAPTGGKTTTIAPDGQGMYLANGSINDFPVTFVVDTGATLIAMNKNQAKRLGLDYKLQGKESLSSTASGMDKIYVVKLTNVAIGDILLHDIQAAVHDGDYPETVLLGNSFLGRVDMKRDGQLLILEQKY